MMRMEIDTVLEMIDGQIEQAEGNMPSDARIRSLIHTQIAQALALAKIAQALDSIHEICEWTDANERRLEELRAEVN